MAVDLGKVWLPRLIISDTTLVARPDQLGNNLFETLDIYFASRTKAAYSTTTYSAVVPWIQVSLPDCNVTIITHLVMLPLTTQITQGNSCPPHC
jgi:hypothetical protein